MEEGETLLSLFSLVHMYMCLGLNTQDWIIYQETHP